MASRSVVTLTTAPAGTGKSYRRCAHFILYELLPDTTLKHLSNFPIQFEEWGEGKAGMIAVAERRGVATRDQVLERIETIPEAETQKWLDGTSGPWDYFRERDLAGYHLAIDEIHNFCGKNSHVSIKKQWQTWLGELRHRGARIEFISQHPQKIAKEIRDEAEILLELVAGESRTDPWFGIGMGDWYNLKAKVTGRYTPCVYELENRQHKSRWSVRKTVKFHFEKELFEVYDSFSAPIQGGHRGEVDKEPWERMSWSKFGLWFLLRNLWSLSSRLGLVALFVWLGLFGGGAKVMAYGMEWMKQRVQSQNASTTFAEEKLSPTMQRLREKYPEAKMSVAGKAVQPQQPKVEPQVVRTPAPPKPEPITDEEIAKEVQPWLLVAVTSDGICFSNGEQYRIGEVVDYGPYEAKEVERIDFGRRRVVVGGVTLRLRSVGDVRLREYAVEVIRERRKSNVR